jgi:integrase
MDGIHLLRYQFQPLLRQAGLPIIRIHDLRHSWATLLLSQGIHPSIVASLLGHSTITVTLDVYSHATPTMQRAATEAMDRLLGS